MISYFSPSGSFVIPVWVLSEFNSATTPDEIFDVNVFRNEQPSIALKDVSNKDCLFLDVLRHVSGGRSPQLIEETTELF